MRSVREETKKQMKLLLKLVEGIQGNKGGGLEFAVRLSDLMDKWMQGCDNMEAVKDKLVMEQLIKTLPSYVRIWVKERKPKTSKEAGECADDYFQARGPGLDSSNGKQSYGTSGRVRRLCHGCGRSGHKIKDCPTTKTAGLLATSTGNGGSGSRRTERGKKDIECYNCHEKGHYSSYCPHNAMFCGQNNTQQGSGIMRSGTVEGKYVKNILLDTGCSRTLVHQKLVSKETFLEGRATTVCCAHGDTVLYPLARVHMEVEGKPIEVEAALSDRLPVGVLLGTDVYRCGSIVGYRCVPTSRAINPTEFWSRRTRGTRAINPTEFWSRRTREDHGNNDKSRSTDTEGTEG